MRSQTFDMRRSKDGRIAGRLFLRRTPSCADKVSRARAVPRNGAGPIDRVKTFAVNQEYPGGVAILRGVNFFLFFCGDCSVSILRFTNRGGCIDG